MEKSNKEDSFLFATKCKILYRKKDATVSELGNISELHN